MSALARALALLPALAATLAMLWWPVLVAGAAAQRPAGPVIQVGHLHGEINAVAPRYVGRMVDHAEQRGAEALVLTLDTPGGLDSAMRDVVQRLLRSSVPVVVYVFPPGARAGSAGVFLVLAADVAAMAPGTNIGAAHPVAAGPGGPAAISDPVLAQKITNDAVAYARSLAQQHGRNADWAERAVRESASLPASEALRQHVVDEVATDLDDLLAKLDGRVVKGPWGERPLHTRGAVLYEEEESFFERFLSVLANPNVAYLLFTIGSYAIVAELYHPGAIVPAVVGSLCLLLALVGFGSLPVNWGGVALLLLAIGLLVAEIKVASHGLLALGGVVAFALGSLLLFEPLATGPFGAAARVSLWLIVLLTAASALFVAGLVRFGLAARRRPPLLMGPLPGDTGWVRSALSPAGTVLVRNELWSAESVAGPVAAGMAVRVLARRGLRLLVEPVAEPEAIGGPGPSGRTPLGEGAASRRDEGASDATAARPAWPGRA